MAKKASLTSGMQGNPQRSEWHDPSRFLGMMERKENVQASLLADFSPSSFPCRSAFASLDGSISLRRNTRRFKALDCGDGFKGARL